MLLVHGPRGKTYARTETFLAHEFFGDEGEGTKDNRTPKYPGDATTARVSSDI